MATTREYTDYLNDQVDIAPADSQEELQAAELIESLFVQHGLETQVQEFDAPIFSRLSSHIYLIVLFLGMVLAGILGTVVSYVGIGMVAVSFLLILLARTGRDILASIGPRARSQNVIGVHRATGPNVVKGNRPIVIIAHYDTPRENFLNNRQFAKWQPLLKRLAWPLTIAVLVLAVMQAIPVIPNPARHVFWVLGVLAALPLLLLGASSIYERFAACTTGANDNKASIAAMLGVLDMVRPGPDDAKEWAQSHPKGVRRSLEDELDEQLDEMYGDEWEDEESVDGDEFVEGDEFADDSYKETYEENDDTQEEPAPRRTIANVAAPVVEEDEYGLRKPSTVRRGAAVLESLQVLPETCEIVYENLSPRDEVIERIQIENGGPIKGEGRFDRIRDAAGGVGEKLGDGLITARDRAESLFERIRAFFANLFHRGESDEIEDNGQVEELEYDDSEYVPDEYEGDEFVDEYDEDEEYDEEYDDEYDEEYDDEYDEDEDYEDELGASPQDGISAPVVEPLEVTVPVVEPAYEPAPAPAVVQEYVPASVTQPFTRIVEPEPKPVAPEPAVQTFAAEVSEAPTPVAPVAPVVETPAPEDLGLTSNLPKLEVPTFTEVPASIVEEPVVNEESVAVSDEFAAARADLEAAREEAAATLWAPDITVKDTTDDVVDEADVAPIEDAADDYDDEVLQQTDMFEVPDASYIYDADPLDVEPSFAEDVPFAEDEYIEEEYAEPEYVEEPVKRRGFWSFFSRFRPAAATVEEDVPEAEFEVVPEAEFELIENDEDYSSDEADETYTAGVPIELVDVSALEHEYEETEVSTPVKSDYFDEVIEELATDEDDDFAPVMDFEPASPVEELEPMAVPDTEPNAADEVEPIAESEVEPEAIESVELEELAADEPIDFEQEVEELTEAPMAVEQSPTEEFEAPVIEPAVEDEPLVVEVDETEELEATAVEHAIETAEGESFTEDQAQDDVPEAVFEPVVEFEPVEEAAPEVEPVAEEEPASELASDTAEDIEVELEPEPEPEAESEPEPEIKPEPEPYDAFLDLDEPMSLTDEPQVTLWTPSDDYEDDGYGSSDAETTLSFRPLKQEDIDAAKAQKEAAETEASSVLHQMFATAPEQEHYEAPRQVDILHEMFATKPFIEPMPIQVQEPEKPLTEELETADEVAEQIVADEPELVEEVVEQSEWLEDEELEAVEAVVEQPITDEVEIEEVFSLEEEPVEEPEEAESVVESGIDARFQSEFIEVIEELEEPEDVIAVEVEEQAAQESEPEVIVADTFDEDVEPEPTEVEEEPVVVEPTPMSTEAEPSPAEVEPEGTEIESEPIEQEPEYGELLTEVAEQDDVSEFTPEPVFDEELDEVPLAEFESIEEAEAEFEPELVPEIIEADTFDDEPEPEPELQLEPEPEPQSEPESEPVAEEEPASEPDELPLAEFEQLDEPEPEPEPEPVVAESQEPAAPIVDPDTLRIIESLKFSTEADVSEDDLADKDVTGLTTIPVEAEADAEDSLPVVEEQMPRPRAVDDPDWGKTNFKPSVVSMGRRAMLLDLPDPSVMAVDQFGSYDDSEDESKPVHGDAEVTNRFTVLSRVPSPLDEPSTYQEAARQESHAHEPEVSDTQNPAGDDQPMRRYNQQQNIGSRSPKKNSKRKMRFGRKRKDNTDQQVESMSDWLGLGDDYDAKKDGRQIGSWDNFEDSDNRGKWKGGATLRAGLRDDEQEEQDDYLGLPNFDSLDLQPKDEDQSEEPQEQEEPQDELAPEELEELREAVLHLGDDDLIAHDIWFVGLGASSLDHAGIKAFLDEHRRDIRGAFLINLDSVGAGDLTLLTNEGMGEKRRGDRRMARMLSNIADALHIDLGHADYSWEETDATPAMQRSVRVATLMGMSSDGVAAHSHTSDDEPEYLNDHQIAGVADIIAELIRRS